MIEIDAQALEALERNGADGPLVMLNLLRFRPDGGRETYQRYAAHVARTVQPTTPLTGGAGPVPSPAR
ncbi:hypothetical protein [Streptomyces sp. NPDC054784]